MAKKITRGITGIKDINKQDFDTNNVNDLLSDGQYSYIHRKKGKSEEYHNLTDNIKTISSDNTDLLTVTNNNKTNNTALLSPKHDAQKEQVLESERNTVSIRHATNGTPEKTKVDTNPQKVLEHSNLLTDYGISKTTTGNTTKLGIEYTSLKGSSFDLNNLVNGKVISDDFANAPTTGWVFVSGYSKGNYAIQQAIKLDDEYNTVYVRRKRDGTWKNWRVQVGDRSVIDGLLAQKQNTLTNNSSIGLINNSLQQLYCWHKQYTHDNGVLKTHVKSISSNTSITTTKEEFNFILKINQGQQSATFTLNEHDKKMFNNIMTTYGASNTVKINGVLFELSNSTLTVSTDANTSNNQVITFSDII